MRKVISFVLTIFIFIATVFLSVSFTLKDVIITTLSDSIVKKQVASRLINSISDLYPNIPSDVLNEVEVSCFNNSKIDSITTKYYDSVINYVSLNEELEIPNITDDVKKIIDDNDQLLKDNNIYLSSNDKDKMVDYLNNESLSKIYKNIVDDYITNKSTILTSLVNVYNIMTSDSLRFTMIITIILSILFIMLLTKSIYKWLFCLASSFIVSGITLAFLASMIVSKITDMISTKISTISINININTLNSIGYIMLITGIILFIIYFIINKISSKKEESSN